MKVILNAFIHVQVFNKEEMLLPLSHDMKLQSGVEAEKSGDFYWIFVFATQCMTIKLFY